MTATNVGVPDNASGGQDTLAPTQLGNIPAFADTGGTVALIATSSINNYWQIGIQNTNSGSSNSSDFVANADNATSSTHYADFGINGSGGGGIPFTAANAAYLYSIDNELDVGALGATGQINIYAGGGTSTPTQKLFATAAGGVIGVGQTCCIGYLKSANMNVTTDNIIPITLPNGAAKFAVTSMLVTNASTSLTTAAGGVYPAVTKGGTPLVAAAQVYTALTGATSLLALTLAAAATNITYSGANLYLNLTSAQGSAATADIYVFGIPLF